MDNAFRQIKILNLFLAIVLIGNVGKGQQFEPIYQLRHSLPVNKILISSDGKLAFSSSEDGTVKVWDVENRWLLRTFEPEGTGGIESIALTGDDKKLAVVKGGKISLWQIETGKVIWKSKIELPNPLPAKKGENETQDIINQIIEASERPDFSVVREMEISRNGEKIVTAGTDLDVWNAHTGKWLFRASQGKYRTVAFSEDGSRIFGVTEDKVFINNASNGNEISSFEIGARNVFALNPGSQKFAFLDKQNKIQVWNLYTGKSEHILDQQAASLTCLKYSSDGKYLLSGDSAGNINLWETARFTLINNFKSSDKFIESLAIDTINRKLIIAESNSTMKLLNFTEENLKLTKSNSKPQPWRAFGADFTKPVAVAFSPDNKLFSVAEGFGKIKVWNFSTGIIEKVLQVPGQQNNRIEFLAFNPEGDQLTILSNGAVTAFNIFSGKVLRTQTFSTPEKYKYGIVSPDGNHLALVTEKNIELHDLIVKSKLLVELPKQEITDSFDFSLSKSQITVQPQELYFSSDNQTLFGLLENKAYFWNSATGKVTGEFLTSDANFQTYLLKTKFSPLSFGGRRRAFSANGQLLAEVGDAVAIKDNTGKVLVNIFALNNTEYLSFTPQGLFDSSSGLVHWRLSENLWDTISTEAFFKEFYYPGLLQDLMTGKTPKAPARDLSQIDIRQPLLKISEIDGQPTDTSTELRAGKKTVKVKVEISDNTKKGRQATFPASSGANDVRLFRNGSLVKLWDKNAFELTEKDGCRQIPAASNSPRKAVCEAEVQITADRNELTAYAFNHDNVKSNDTTAEITGSNTLKRKGKLQILAIGINDYRNSRLNLKFAVSDAVDFGAELQKQQIKLGIYETPEVVRLTDGEATKQNILFALERFANGEKAAKPENLSAALEKKLTVIEKTQPEDILVIYFAGHGTASKDRFYLIPTDGFLTTAQTEEARIKSLHQQSISDLELETILRDLDAGQILLVIDACNSGQALEAEEKRRGPMNSKGLAQLAFEKGMSILTAAQSYQAALEVSRTPEGKKIEHGLLTFSLLDGLTSFKADRDTDQSISEREWFTFTVSEVPRMQLEEMQRRNAEVLRGGGNSEERSDLIFLNGDNSKLPPEKRGLQTPRVFYRRENPAAPLIVSKP